MGADDLISNGHNVAVIEYHSGDSFETTSSAARISYYGITGFPTSKFDGVETVVGGSSSSSMYSSYLPKVNLRNGIDSDFSIDIYGENTTGNTYSITVEVTEMNAYTGSDVRLQFAVTETEIPFSWNGQPTVNHCERLMAPDHNGTALTLTGSGSQLINLSFTLDPTWNTNYIEFVCFVQDHTTKEVLQGSKVELANLQPFAATAIFSASDTIPCIGNQVQFSDLSMGAVTSWTWNFEGGTPATSSDPNPLVTYNTLGEFDVQLIVSDGTVIDTMTNVDMIEVVQTPAQADTPVGDNELCENGGGIQYTTNPVTYATSYEWVVDPSSAGTISGSGTTGTLTLMSGYTGALTVKVRAVNNCGDGVYSNTLSCDVYALPVVYQLSDGAGYCDGGNGVELKLYGSDADADYELFLDGTSTGTIVAGTGDTISFGYQTGQGIHTVVAENDYCTEDMMGNAYVFVMYPPAQASTPQGDDDACNNEDESEYSTEAVSQAEGYQWVLTPSEAGTITNAGNECWIDWSEEFSGNAELTVMAFNDCGDGAFSEAKIINVHDAPNPVIAGENLVCQGYEDIPYSTLFVDGHNYTWEIEGGTIALGQGSNEIKIDWGAPGTGKINLTQESQEGCVEAAEEYVVTIDECVGISNILENSISLYPNPSTSNTTLELNCATSQVIRVRVMDQLGQVIIDREIEVSSGTNMIPVQTENLLKGIYHIQIEEGNSLIHTKKFIKTN